MGESFASPKLRHIWAIGPCLGVSFWSNGTVSRTSWCRSFIPKHPVVSSFASGAKWIYYHIMIGLFAVGETQLSQSVGHISCAWNPQGGAAILPRIWVCFPVKRGVPTQENTAPIDPKAEPHGWCPVLRGTSKTKISFLGSL